MNSYKRHNSGKTAGALKRASGQSKLRHMNYVLGWRESLSQAQDAEYKRIRGQQCHDVCQEIRDNLTQGEYFAWWEAAPENSFYDAACAKLLDLKLNGGLDLIDVDNWRTSPEYLEAETVSDAFDFDAVQEIPYG